MKQQLVGHTAVFSRHHDVRGQRQHVRDTCGLWPRPQVMLSYHLVQSFMQLTMELGCSGIEVVAIVVSAEQLR